MKYNIAVGADTSAYASFEVDLDHEPTEEEVINLARTRLNNLQFEPEYDLHSFRIVDVQNLAGEIIHEQLDM